MFSVASFKRCTLLRERRIATPATIKTEYTNRSNGLPSWKPPPGKTSPPAVNQRDIGRDPIIMIQSVGIQRDGEVATLLLDSIQKSQTTKNTQIRNAILGGTGLQPYNDTCEEKEFPQVDWSHDELSYRVIPQAHRGFLPG